MRAHAYKRGDMGITIMVSLDVDITVLVNGHIYASTDWLKDVFPDADKHLKQVEETIRPKLA